MAAPLGNASIEGSLTLFQWVAVNMVIHTKTVTTDHKLRQSIRANVVDGRNSGDVLHVHQTPRSRMQTKCPSLTRASESQENGNATRRATVSGPDRVDVSYPNPVTMDATQKPISGYCNRRKIAIFVLRSLPILDRNAGGRQTSSGLRVTISSADRLWTSASRSRFLGNRLRRAWIIVLDACAACHWRAAWSAASHPR